MTALLSLAPVAAACYLLATLKGHAVLLLFLAASLAWCAWAVMRERRCAQLERLARMAEVERLVEIQREEMSVEPSPPVVSHPPAQLPNFLATRTRTSSNRDELRGMAYARTAEVAPPVVHAGSHHNSANDGVRPFPMHKLSR